MRTRLSRSRLRLAGILVVLLVALGVAATLASGAPTAPRARPALARPALVLTSRNPATVRGTGFRPNTRIRVLLLIGQAQVRRPLTNSRGTFTTRFPTVLDSCSGYTVTATEPGHAPVVLRPAQPACASA
jgi:hypothetical protein